MFYIVVPLKMVIKIYDIDNPNNIKDLLFIINFSPLFTLAIKKNEFLTTFSIDKNNNINNTLFINISIIIYLFYLNHYALFFISDTLTLIA